MINNLNNPSIFKIVCANMNRIMYKTSLFKNCVKYVTQRIQFSRKFRRLGNAFSILETNFKKNCCICFASKKVSFADGNSACVAACDVIYVHFRFNLNTFGGTYLVLNNLF